MNRALVHGALLVLMLIVAFVTWTAEDRPESDSALTPVWNHDPEDVARVTYRSAARTIVLERRGSGRDSYLWGVQRDSAGAVSRDSVAPGATLASQTSEYPVGDEGETIVAELARLRVVRDLGEATAQKRAAYGFSDSAAVLTLRMRNRTERALALGKVVLGGGSIYVQDLRANRIYVVPVSLLRPFEIGGDMLRLMKLQSFEPEEVATVTVRADTAVRTMRRRAQGAQPMPLWTPPDSDRPDDAFGNFMAQIDQLWAARYLTNVAADTLQLIVRVDYLAGDGDTLGFLELFRTRSTDAPPVYLLRTGRTVVFGEVYGPLGERVEQDVATVLAAPAAAR